MARHRRRSTLALSVAAGVCLGLIAVPGTAAADPGPAALTQQVAEASHQLEIVSEQVNQARDELAAQQAAAAQAAQAAADAENRLGSLDVQIRQLARSAYTTGGVSPVNVMLSSHSPGELVSQLGTLDAIAGHQQAVLQQVNQAAAAAQAARQTAEAAATAAQRTLDQVTTEQSQLQAEVADYQRQYAALTAPQQQAVVDTVSGTASSAADPVAQAAVAPVAAASGAAAVAVQTALAQVGKPYVYGSDGPSSFDCSGLTKFAYAAAGVALPHSSSAQSGMGQPVSLSSLQPGDLVFFYHPVSHVAMYIGNGKIVHASTSGVPVKVVDLSSVPGAVSARRMG